MAKLELEALDKFIVGESWIGSQIDRYRDVLCDEIGARWGGSEKDKETFLKLIASADALVESTRPGTFDGWGLSQEVLLNTNENLVTTSITPFGQIGPY